MIAGYNISSKKEDMDFSVIYAFISSSYWAQGIAEGTLRRAIENSICFGVFIDSGEQVGFARVITDTATFAYLADVFILENHRGKGLSKWLISTIIDHPDLQKLRRFLLITKDAQGLYKQFEFKSLASPERFMEKWTPDIYQR